MGWRLRALWDVWGVWGVWGEASSGEGDEGRGHNTVEKTTWREAA